MERETDTQTDCELKSRSYTIHSLSNMRKIWHTLPVTDQAGLVSRRQMGPAQCACLTQGNQKYKCGGLAGGGLVKGG